MKNKVTITDIAKQLNVSTTTINIALGGKGRVSEKTRQLVIETCKRLGYKPNKVAMGLARKSIRIGVIINSNFPVFHNELIKGAKEAQSELEDFNVYGEYFIYTLANNRLTILEKMQELGDKEFDGIVVCAGDDVRDYSRVIDKLYNKNIPVVSIVSDIPDSRRIFSVRVDGRLAGKMAAELLYWFTDGGTVAIFTGFKDRGVHKESINGFMEQVKNKHLDVINIFENQDDFDIAYYATEKLLKEYPETAGIYINSANSESVCRKITELGKGGKIKIVASDIFPELNRYLKDGIVHATIFQDPFRQGKLAFEQLYEYIIGGKKQLDNEILLRPQIVLESNIDSYI